MKKSLILAFALAASVLAFVSCNKDDKNDPETQTSSPIKGVTFYCDHERGGYVRESLYFGFNDDFLSGRDNYEDAARTQLISEGGDYGTYVLNEEQQYIDLTFIGAYNVVNGKRELHPGQQAQRDGRRTYKLEGDTLTTIAENGWTQKYWKKK